MNRHLEKLSEKLIDTTVDSHLTLNFSSLSEAEQSLFERVNEISEEYHRTGNEELLVKNNDLIRKDINIMHKRVTEMYCYTVLMTICGLTGLDEQIVKYFFELHFLNFEADLFECVRNLQTWEKSDCQEFFNEQEGKTRKYYSIPRSYGRYNNESSSDTDNIEKAQNTENENQEKLTISLITGHKKIFETYKKTLGYRRFAFYARFYFLIFCFLRK